ncbi:hypothetical protein HHI36_010765 [Cryptolaemus montrouzieri]|uniref:Uncharacterized protein n=1 Tax=Cryptolaemus montrouzieri TaxID=559131 RepID=A0ABD2MJN8_9CUCU
MEIIDPQPIQKNEDRSKNLLNIKDLKALNERIKNKFAKPVVKLISPLPLNVENTKVESINQSDRSISNSNKGQLKLQEISLLKLKFSVKNPEEIENQIKNVVKNWITLDTLIFVHGEDEIKKILTEKKLSEYFDNLKVTQLEVTQQKKYVDICKRLQRQEIIEEKWDNACRSSNKLQPLPDYNQLKQETKKLDIKVKTFYGGMLYEADDSNFPIKETKENEQNNEEGVPSVLPLLDVYSQNALRRRVLLDGLYKGARFFLDIVKYDSAILFTDLQDLVRTFKLKADNVVFKPIIWNYLGLICLRTLALKDNELKIALNKKEATELENLMLEQLPGKSDVVLNCLRIIENVDVFLKIILCLWMCNLYEIVSEILYIYNYTNSFCDLFPKYTL